MKWLNFLFGRGRNVIAETAEVFRVNSDKQSDRDSSTRQTAMQQFGNEFRSNRNWFDSLMDGINRIPRPMLALGIIALFVTAMFDPTWFAARMIGLAAVPEPMWWLFGLVMSFYFGGRYQMKSQEFNMKRQVEVIPEIMESRKLLEDMKAGEDAPDEEVHPMQANTTEDVDADTTPMTNPVLMDWKKGA